MSDIKELKATIKLYKFLLERLKYELFFCEGVDVIPKRKIATLNKQIELTNKLLETAKNYLYAAEHICPAMYYPTDEKYAGCYVAFTSARDNQQHRSTADIVAYNKDYKICFKEAMEKVESPFIIYVPEKGAIFIY